MQTKRTKYYDESIEEFKKVDQLENKPSLLLHACCGPCACFPLTFLCPHFNVTIMFNNSNIYPKEEHDRRLNELIKFLEYFKRDYGYEVNLVTVPYDNDKYNEDLEPYKDMREGQERCHLCYEKRMKEAYDYAEANGFDYFTTVMTISRQKDGKVLNEIGEKLSKTHSKTKYFYSDFKKNKGIEVARQMRIHYDLYQQLYCGCKYTYEKGLEVASRKGQ